MDATERLYTVKEIFYSLQGEGEYTGKPAIFVRFCGCNLKCPFCDTDFSGGTKMTQSEIVEQITSLSDKCKFIVFTGGEPTLQLTESLINTLHDKGYYLAMETNGTRAYPQGIDWVTVSPKNDFCSNSTLWSSNYIADEVKVVYNGENRPEIYGKYGRLKFIQPCDTGDSQKNERILQKTIDWLKERPDWRLSLQTHKIINVR